ncbi:MAG: YidC/Oxa1 family membrane protein insertase [Eubacteriales bacterium]|nr:YidC/Oxa1 family membrane protein insertase [Eubacteriales bacterium]MDD4389415.1 YidC/Oxa1 family membrane protein insertase [Eubacteriales bacterium]
MGIIATPIGALLGLIYSIVDSYGVALIIFTVIVKICLYPLYAKQIQSTAKMSEVQPRLLEIQNKYKDDKNKMNEKLMEFYKEENYNPMRGCLPMIVQMPIIFGVFTLLRNPMKYIDNTEMLLAVHESFFWIKDLSQPDLWILPIAAGITTYIAYVQMQSQQMPSGGQGQQVAGMMKIMKYVFPVMIVVMGRSFPAGLAMYWFVGTLVQILFNFRLKRVRSKIESGKSRKNKSK